MRHAVGLLLGFAGVAVLVVGSGGGRLSVLGVVELVLAALVLVGRIGLVAHGADAAKPAGHDGHGDALRGHRLLRGRTC